ncbi:MAG: phage minor head protein [Burkholderiaceae bacterium]
MPRADDLGTLDFAGGKFQEQIDFFRAKLNLPTERYDDILRAAHDKAFIVAGAQKADLLADLRKAVDKSITGGSIGEFRKDFAEAVRKSGWSGWAGEGSKAGEAWRTRVIYQTNIATSYAAGRWRQLNDPDLKAVRPYWRYIHADGVVNPRPLHLAWGDSGLTLPNDHPFWRTHFPPNGWGCRCRVTAVRKPGAADATEPPAGWDTSDPRTSAPPGIDKGWDYAPGASTDRSLQQLVDDKLIRLDAAIGAAMWQTLKTRLIAEKVADFSRFVDIAVADGVSRSTFGVAGVLGAKEVEFLATRGVSPQTAEIAIEDRLLVGKKALRHALGGDALTLEEWKSVPQGLADEPKVYFDNVNGTLLYVLPSPGDSRSIKLVIEVNYVIAKKEQTLNLARTGFKINPQALEDKVRYQAIR